MFILYNNEEIHFSEIFFYLRNNFSLIKQTYKIWQKFFCHIRCFIQKY